MQRLRVKFSRGEEVKFISHLDLMRFWERALRRARVPLAYSEGFTLHPRISLAAPLPLGVTSEAELMDIWLTRWMPPKSLIIMVSKQLPHGISILDVGAIELSAPSLQSQVRFAEYRVDVETDKTVLEVTASLQKLLSTKQLPWQHVRDTKTRSYDLRALVDDLWLIGCQNSLCTLGMRLRCDAGGSGRPEQVAAALGFPQRLELVHRTKLILRAG